MAEGFKGQYAPELFNEEKRYYLLQAQEFANLTDAELRDMHRMSNTFTRRFIQTELGDSAVGNGFKITEHPSDSTGNFLISGGSGSLDDPGVLFLKGYRLSLRNNIGYKDQTNTGSITDDAYTRTYAQTPFPSLTPTSGSSHNFFGVTNLGGTTIVVGESPVVLKSTDTGRNFNNISAFGDLYTTTFTDSTIVYAVGFDGSNPVIGRSTTTGSSWFNLLGYSTFDASPVGAFYGVSFVNKNTGYIVGALGQIFKTDDGAAVWPQWSKKAVGDTTSILRAVDCYDATNVWVVGDNKTIMYTGDGGVTWDMPVSPDGTHFKGVSALSASTVIVCGTNGHIQKTTNGGGTWVKKTTGTSVDLNGIYFVDALNGWAVGDTGTVVHTADGGSTWDATIINPSYNFESVFFKDATTGFIVGNSGSIYRTVDGINWDRYRTDYVYVDFHLAEVSGDTSSEYYDSTLIDPLIGQPSANRLRIVQDVKVSEGWPTPSDYTTAGPDGTVIQHYTYTLAKIYKPFGFSAILNANITDARKVVRTIEELDYALKNGGVDASSLAAGSITPDKLVTSADYTMGSLQVIGDSTIAGDLRVMGTLHVEDYRPTIVTDNLVVKGSSSLGDLVRPYDSSTSIYGTIIQNNDTSRVALNIHSYPTTVNAPVINILQDGSGSVLKITQTGTSVLPLMDVTSTTGDYDISIKHSGKTGGVIRSWDDSTKASYLISKDATQSYAPVFDITTNAYGPTIAIHNGALCDTAAIGIDQSSGSALKIKTRNDASSIVIDSTSSGTDLRIVHGGSGYVMTVDSSGAGVFQVQNNKGTVGTFTQNANADIFVLNKGSTGSGRALEINHSGIDPAAQISNLGKGIGLHVSHVGDSSSPAIDVYVAGAETGPAVRIRKANNDSTNDVGEALYVINQGFSPAVKVLHDNTDSTSALLSIANYTNGFDASALNWRIDKSGNFFTNGDVTTSRLSFDSTYYLSAERFFLDSSNFDSSNPGIAGRVFQDGGFLRFSDGTTELPPPGGFGKTGLQGTTGISGIDGPQGVTGLALGATGIQGVTGFQGDPGLQGIDGQTGLQGVTGLALGSTGIQGVTGFLGVDGQTGLQGVTGLALGATGVQGVTGFLGQTGIQGVTGLSGIGQTGIQGVTGFQGIGGQTGVQGVTGIQGEEGPQGDLGQTGIQGVTGLPGIGQTGIQGVTGFLGVDGQTGIQGVTGILGIDGQTGVQGVTGVLGINGQTGIQGVTGLSSSGMTGAQGLTGLQAPLALSLGLFAATDSVAVSNGTVGIPISAKLNGKNLTELLAVVATPGIASTTDVTVRRRRAGVEVFMLSTATKISGGSYYSNNGVVNVLNQQVLLGDLLFVDVTNTNTTAPLGLSVVLTFDV